MNAIIVTGGKQYKVSEGDVIYIEKLERGWRYRKVRAGPGYHRW